jgi:hypothetical protein
MDVKLQEFIYFYQAQTSDGIENERVALSMVTPPA